MVDFKNENVVGRSPKDLNQIIRLEKRWNTLQALEEYHRDLLLHGNGDINELHVRTRLLNLAYDIRGELKRSFKEPTKEWTDMKKNILTGSMDQVEIVILQILDVLDDIGLTRIDTGLKINYQDMEEENAHHGLD